MNKLVNYIGFLIFFIIIILAGNPFYIINEGQQVIITQFGKPVGKPIKEAGLHFKVPFIQKVNYFEKRILEWDGYPSQIPTKDKKYIWVDTTARWRIIDPLKFFQSVHDERGAHARLDDIIDAAVRDIITSYNLIEIVRSTNRIIEEADVKKSSQDKVLEKICFGREKITQEIIKKAKELVPKYGIELIDVRIKRINYIEDVRRKVYERMIAERRRAAERYRSEGRGISAEIEGKTQKELKKILSEAYKKAQEIKGKADAQATQIYASSFGKDPEFYSFLKTLGTYEEITDKDTTFIITIDSEYWKYLKSFKEEIKD